MMALFSSHPGHRAKSRHAQSAPQAPARAAAPPLPAPVLEAPARESEEGTVDPSWRMSLEAARVALTTDSQELAIVTDGDDEPLPRRIPGATLGRTPEPGSPADELNGLLLHGMPGADDLRRLLDGIRGYDPRAKGSTMPNPALRESRPQPAVREPQPATRPAVAPGATVLLSFSRTGPTVVQPVDGLPERRTAGGKPVIHLGDDPRNDGEAFALGRMSDAYLDGLITVLMEERSARLKARNGSTGAQPSLAEPAFTPRQEGAA